MINKLNIDLIKILKFINLFSPKFLKKRIKKKFFKYNFLPTTLKDLPKNNYPEKFNYNDQKELISKFKLQNKQSSFMTCPHLISLLSARFKNNQEFSFLDIGGDSIDFFLELKKNFKNVKYYVFNQKNLLDVFMRLKMDFDLENLNIISEISKINNNKYDFINFGSCIQYFSNYEDFLNNIINLKSRYLFFSGLPNYTSDKDILKKNMIVKQVNVFPQINYLYLINKDHFYNIFLKKRYNLCFENKNTTDKINFDNFNNFVEKINYIDVMFENNNL